MKYLITFQDSGAVVQPEEPSRPSYGIGDLPARAADWFEYDEYVTIEWDSNTGQIRVCHPMEGRAKAREIAQPFSVYRKHVKTSTYGSSQTYLVSIYSDGVHTCECKSWFFENSNFQGCKHIEAVLEENRHGAGKVWEILDHDDRQEFRVAQTRLYDTRPESSNG